MLEAPLNISLSLPNSSSLPFIPLGGERQRESKVGPCPRTQHWPRMRSACSVVQRSIHKATARATGLLLCLKRRKNCGQPTVYTYSALLITLSGMYGRRRRQRQLRKTIGLMSKINRSARVFYILLHFFAVLCKTTT